MLSEIIAMLNSQTYFQLREYCALHEIDTREKEAVVSSFSFEKKTCFICTLQTYKRNTYVYMLSFRAWIMNHQYEIEYDIILRKTIESHT